MPAEPRRRSEQRALHWAGSRCQAMLSICILGAGWRGARLGVPKGACGQQEAAGRSEFHPEARRQTGRRSQPLTRDAAWEY